LLILTKSKPEMLPLQMAQYLHIQPPPKCF
jgi:hypothetical protein